MNTTLNRLLAFALAVFCFTSTGCERYEEVKASEKRLNDMLTPKPPVAPGLIINGVSSKLDEIERSIESMNADERQAALKEARQEASRGIAAAYRYISQLESLRQTPLNLSALSTAKLQPEAFELQLMTIESLAAQHK